MNKYLNSNKIVGFLRNNGNYLSKRFGVKNIGVFGSFVKNSHNRKSDIDVLVEFKPGCKTFDNYMELKFYLEDNLLREIDLCLKKKIRKELKKTILKEVVYA